MRSRVALVCGLLLLLCGAECASVGLAVRGTVEARARLGRRAAQAAARESALVEMSASRVLASSEAKFVDPVTLTLLISVAVVLVNMAKKAWGAYQAYKAAMEELASMALESRRVACEMRLDAYRMMRILDMQVQFVDQVLQSLPSQSGSAEGAETADGGGAHCLASQVSPLDPAALADLPRGAQGAVADMWRRLAAVERAISVEGGLQCVARPSQQVAPAALRSVLDQLRGGSGPLAQLKAQVEGGLAECMRDDATGTYLLGPLRHVFGQLSPAPSFASALRPAGTTVGSTAVAQTLEATELVPDDEQAEAGDNVAQAASAVFSPDEAEEMTGHSALALGVALVMVGFNKAVDFALEKAITAGAEAAHGGICREMIRADEVTHDVADVTLSVIGLMRTLIHQTAAAAATSASAPVGGEASAPPTHAPLFGAKLELDPMVHEAIRMAYLYDAADPIEELRLDASRPNRAAEASFAQRMVDVLQHPLLPDRFRYRLLASPRVFHFLDAMMAIAEADAIEAMSRAHDKTRSFACPMLDVEQTAFNYHLRELPTSGATLVERLSSAAAHASVEPCKLSDLAYAPSVAAFVAMDSTKATSWYQSLMGASPPTTDVARFCNVAVDKFYVEHFVHSKVAAGSPIANVLVAAEKARCESVAGALFPVLKKPSASSDFVKSFHQRIKEALGLVGGVKTRWADLSVVFGIVKGFADGVKKGSDPEATGGPLTMKDAWGALRLTSRTRVAVGAAQCAGLEEFPRFVLSEWEDKGDRESLWYLELLRSLSSNLALFQTGARLLTSEVREKALEAMNLAPDA